MIYDDLHKIVQKRRSIRRFKSDPLPREMITQVIEIARWAPSGFNMQPWEFVVVQKAELRDKIVAAIAPYWEQSREMEATRSKRQGRAWKLKGMTNEPGDYTTAPVYILMIGDPRLQEGLPMGVQCDPNRRRMIYLSSLANAFLYMHLGATSLGLASQWVSAVQVPYAACLIKDLLDIPSEMEVYDMLVLGYPAITPPVKLMRELDSMVHWDGVNDGGWRSDHEVAKYIRKARSWTIGTHRRKVKDLD
jgi:nitroreductase